MTELVFLWALLAFIPAIIAAKKGRSGIAWWLYGFLLLPIAIVHAIVTDNPNRNRACPFCREKIMKDAVVCPYCRKDLPASAPPPATTAQALEIASADGQADRSGLIVAALMVGILAMTAIVILVKS